MALEIEGDAVARLQLHVVQHHIAADPGPLDMDVEGAFAEHIESQVFKQRYATRQGKVALAVEDF